MRTIVAGGRDFDDYELLDRSLDWFEEHISGRITVVSGMARGADALGVRWAEERRRTLDKFPADWDKHGKGAGYRRNVEMADFATALVAFWDGKSRGTKHMIDTALRKGLIVKVVYYSRTPDIL